MDDFSPAASSEAKRPSGWVRAVDSFWRQLFGPLFKGFETFGHILVLTGHR
jgi:hypothetical protein